jgi:protein-S-isoprenylcysteine O-methyltransferase Ste14
MKFKLSYNIFKASKSQNNKWNLTKTYLQTSIFYSIFLGLFPYLAILFQEELNFTSFNQNKLVGTFFLILFTSLGLYSGYIMSTIGKGTPLPFDCANKLVIKGPYKYVRNPMAVAGIGQAFSIGIYNGSYLILLYAMSGALLWHYLVRPKEENDLFKRFGQKYSGYKGKVGLWIPGLNIKLKKK